MSTYAQEMIAKHGVPFDPKTVKSARGFKYGDRVQMVAPDWYSLVPVGSQGQVDTVESFGPRSVSPDPLRRLIMVDWDEGGLKSVPYPCLKKIK